VCDPKRDLVCCAPFCGVRGLLKDCFAGFGGNDCVTPNDCGIGIPVACNSTLDCENAARPGTICCAQYTLSDGGGIARYTSIRCRTPAECLASPSYVLCDRQAPTPCPPGLTCQSHPTEPAFDVRR
jgi:hypothetical protein